MTVNGYDDESELILNPVELWRNPNPDSTCCARFIEYVNKSHGLNLTETYDDLYSWSISDIPAFWADVWSFTNVRSSTPYTSVVDAAAPMFPRPQFFAGATLSYAQNLLFPTPVPDADSAAVYSVTEFSTTAVTWRELRERVRKLSVAMRRAGVKPGDRVAGYVSNNVSTLVSLLATSAVGGIWSSTSSEIGSVSVVERLAQIEPVLLFTDNASIYNQKVFNNLAKVSEIVAKLPSLKTVVVVETSSASAIDLASVTPAAGVAVLADDFVANVGQDEELQFEMLDFDFPLFIVYSSGTTGKPKCIVHGQGGSLIQHKKEHFIHMDMSTGDVFFQYTTCSWMMWQWLISGLASGATLVLYDGSPFQPAGESSMFKLIEELGVKYYGTSAKYLSILEQKNYMPRETYAMKNLRMVTSTGSVLSPSTFSYIYRSLGPDIVLSSITGGTDILSLFGAPSLMTPVYKGEIQVRGLGMAVEVWSPEEDGKRLDETGQPGDLVCTKVFPCMPVMFWNDPAGEKYEASYFERFGRHVWHHGDFVRLSPKTNGLIMLGRSDGVLKPAGVRFGSSEIYNVLIKEFPTEVDDALCVGMKRAEDMDETVVLFLKMQPQVSFTPELVAKIKKTIREQLSPRHVPGIIDETPEIPFTANGKKTETIVKGIISKSKIKVGASVANADCLQWYRDWAEAH
ncbi:acetoacetate-CoA ligase [Myxozyma melibiosi]|uniref:Acetoacetate-CoA ligase n=1 Tax=Myxozyma melibiosi TaxID=54550 RepID=A0ABR1F6J3_9ASCO